MTVASTFRRALPWLGTVICALLLSAGAARAESWGTLGNLRVPAGTATGSVNLTQEESAVAVDSANGSFYVADTVEVSKHREIRLQRFTAKGEASSSVEFAQLGEEGEEEAGTVQGAPELAVDPERDRVYVLLRYERREEDSQEEKEEKKEAEKLEEANKGKIEEKKAQLKKIEEEIEAHEAPVAKLRREASEALEKNEAEKAKKLQEEEQRLIHEPAYEEVTHTLTDEKQEKEAELARLDKPKPRKPLDSGEYAAGALYGYEFNGSKLVALNKGESGKAKKGEPERLAEGELAGPEKLAAIGEQVKEPLLNPLGLSVEASSGAVVVLGTVDKQANHDAVANHEAQQECRVAAQWLTVSGATGSATAGLARRYVDATNAIGQAHPADAGASAGQCGYYEQEEPVEWQAYTPVVTGGGRLLVTSTGEGGDGEEEAEIWELPGSYSAAHEELQTTPHKLYHYPVEEKLDIATGNEERAEAVMSPAMSALATPGKSGQGKIYLGARFEEPLASSQQEGQVNGVVVLNYKEPAGTAPLEVTEEGYVVGFHPFLESPGHVKASETKAEFEKEKCGIPSPSSGAGKSGLGSGTIPVGAYLEGGKEAVLAFSSGARDELIGMRLAPGGNAAECLQTALESPQIMVGGKPASGSIAAGTEAQLQAEVFAGPAKKAEWEFKYTVGGETHTEATVIQSGTELLEGGTFASLKHVFAHEGEYEITLKVVAAGSNLAGPTAEPSKTVKQHVGVAISATILPFKPTSPIAGETVREIQALIEDPAIKAPSEKVQISYEWLFGDGESSGVKTLWLEHQRTETPEVSHLYSQPCSCKLELKILEPAMTASRTVTVREQAKVITKNETPTTTPIETKTEPQQKVESYKEGTAEAKLSGSTISVGRNGALTLTVTCGGGAKQCSGKLTLKTLTAVASGAKHKKSILTLGTASFLVSGGAQKKIVVHLSAAARSLLAHSHTLRARATLVAENGEHAQHTSTATVTLRLAAVKHK